VWKTAFLVQGLYYLITGLWPIVHIRSFMAVSGPKTDEWLVKTVGALVAVIGFVLLSEARRRSSEVELFMLGIGSAVSLGLIDVVYVSKGTISPVYLADAALEFPLAVVLSIEWYRLRHS
jgi:hypothetical protein